MTAPMKPNLLSKEDKNYLIDAAVVSFAIDLIGLAQKVERKEVDLSDVVVNGSDHRNDKKISWLMEKLQKKLQKTFDKLNASHRSMLPYHIKLIQNAEIYGGETIQPDYFAIYLLRFRFKYSKGRAIDKRFRWIAERSGDLFTILELLDETPIAGQDESMSDLAHNILIDL